MTTTALEIPSLKDKVSPEEWAVRVDLAASYRLVSRFGWEDLVFTHISARVPGTEDQFLINPYGLFFDEITASSLVKMDLQGNVIGDQGRFNAAGFTIHSGVYKARPEAMCVLHTHTRAGAGLSLLRNGLRPISQDALHVLDDVAYHEYGVPASQEECDALGVACAKGSCVVLLNHGLLTWGETIHGALMRLYMLERACELEVMARMMDEPPVMVADEVVRKAAARMKKLRGTPDYGLMEFEGLVRTVDRKGADYRR
jgi:ribulose-5-phosphate 4-epimerase/fuculose-1-phosphate aldolase